MPRVVGKAATWSGFHRDRKQCQPVLETEYLLVFAVGGSDWFDRLSAVPEITEATSIAASLEE